MNDTKLLELRIKMQTDLFNHLRENENGFDTETALKMLKGLALKPNEFCEKLLHFTMWSNVYADFLEEMTEQGLDDEEHWDFPIEELDEALNAESEIYLVAFDAESEYNPNGPYYRFCETGECI